ncbi:MAG: hypothetical protein IT242_02380 [Bacteroidia bacterium]|nr:hypothetical protein [Bacteroidia bacterium]
MVENQIRQIAGGRKNCLFFRIVPGISSGCNDLHSAGYLYI